MVVIIIILIIILITFYFYFKNYENYRNPYLVKDDSKCPWSTYPYQGGAYCCIVNYVRDGKDEFGEREKLMMRNSRGKGRTCFEDRWLKCKSWHSPKAGKSKQKCSTEFRLEDKLDTLKLGDSSSKTFKEKIDDYEDFTANEKIYKDSLETIEKSKYQDSLNRSKSLIDDIDSEIDELEKVYNFETHEFKNNTRDQIDAKLTEIENKLDEVEIKLKINDDLSSINQDLQDKESKIVDLKNNIQSLKNKLNMNERTPAARLRGRFDQVQNKINNNKYINKNSINKKSNDVNGLISRISNYNSNLEDLEKHTNPVITNSINLDKLIVNSIDEIKCLNDNKNNIPCPIFN